MEQFCSGEGEKEEGWEPVNSDDLPQGLPATARGAWGGKSSPQGLSTVSPHGGTALYPAAIFGGKREPISAQTITIKAGGVFPFL